MENDFDKLVLALSSPSVSTDVLYSLISFLKHENNELFISFVSNSFQSLLILEQWSWKLLSEDPHQWINNTTYIELLHALISLNRSLVFDCDTIDNDSKISLLLPESIDEINGIFRNIDQIDDDNSSYWMIINRVFDNHSSFLLEHLEYCKLPMIDHIGEYLVRNYIMNKQFKLYLWHLQKPQIAEIKMTAKMLFYIKTCSFYFYVYLTTKYQTFFCPVDEMVRYLGEDYVHIIHTHASTIAQWNKEFLGCIAHLIALVCRCSWWDGVTPSPMKILLPTEQIACQYVQDLMGIISHTPFYNDIKSQRCNDETVLLESSLIFLLDIGETQIINWLFRSNTAYQKIILNVAENSVNDIISICAYDMLSLVLADEHIKELKMTDAAVVFSLNMLEKAWHDPSKIYKQIPIIYILQGRFGRYSND